MVVDLANRAYEAAQRRDLDAAAELIVEIARLGPASLSEAMIAWVDRTMHLMGIRPGVVMGFEMAEDGTDEVHPVDQIEPGIAWAGRMFAARVARDREMWHALIGSMPADPNGRCEYVLELLTTMVVTADAAEEDMEKRDCCSVHTWADLDPALTASRRAVAHLN